MTKDGEESCRPKSVRRKIVGKWPFLGEKFRSGVRLVAVAVAIAIADKQDHKNGWVKGERKRVKRERERREVEKGEREKIVAALISISSHNLVKFEVYN